MLSIRLDKDTEKSLTDIANAACTTKTALVREALERYIEDKTDYILAAKSIENMQKTFALEDVMEKFKNEL
jgi:predicted DNA-binding protein